MPPRRVRYAPHPPITRLTRDPEVVWHEPSKRWIMVMTLNCEAWDVDNRFITF